MTVTSLELPGRSYKAICNCLLSVLNLEACGDDLAVNQGQLPPVFGLGQLSKRPRAP